MSANTSRFGPGYPGNTQTSPAQDKPLPGKPNEGDPCFNTPEAPLRGKNGQAPASTDGVQSQASVNKVGRGTSGRAVNSKLGM